jgi:Flp pilus assembly pilin Flp
MLKRIAASSLRNLLRLAGEQAGGEVVEYAIIIGLIAVLSIGAIAKFGGNVFGNWSTVSTGIDTRKVVSSAHYIMVGAETTPTDITTLKVAPATRPTNLETADNSSSVN